LRAAVELDLPAGDSHPVSRAQTVAVVIPRQARRIKFLINIPSGVVSDGIVPEGKPLFKPAVAGGDYE